jgi:UV DNA damage endonuclease
MNFNNWSLCCISKSLSDSKQNFKTMTLSQFNKQSKIISLKELCSRILHNIVHTHRTIRFCQDNNISGYRISSSLFPVITHDSVNLCISELPNFSEIKAELERIKQTIQKKFIKLSAHPSEYISLSTNDPNILKNSFRDLAQHAELFDLLGLPQDYSCPLNIHVRKDGDPRAITDNVMRNYETLPDNVRNRLVLENNDNRNGVWSIQNLFKYFSEPYKIPITFDYLHHSLLPGDLSEKDAFQLAHSTWGMYTPLFHYSEGIVEKNMVTKKHKDLPDSYPTIHNPHIFLDVELKHKDQAIFKLQNHIL